MRDMFDIFLAALAEYLEAQDAYDKASACYEGDSPDWDLRVYYDRWVAARDGLTNALDDYIDCRIDARMKEAK